MLEDEADPPLLRAARRGVLAGDGEVAFIGIFQPGDDAQQRRLARAGGAEQGHELAGPDAEIDAVERGEIAEALDDAFQLDTHRPSLMDQRRRDTEAWRTDNCV